MVRLPGSSTNGPTPDSTLTRTYRLSACIDVMPHARDNQPIFACAYIIGLTAKIAQGGDNILLTPPLRTTPNLPFIDNLALISKDDIGVRIGYT